MMLQQLLASSLIAATTLWTLLGAAVVAATAIRSRRRHGLTTSLKPLAPLTVLKPLAGADPSLEHNLAGFFEQDHPSYEIVFGVANRRDPAVAILERLCGRYPHVAARLVLCGDSRARNPKVSSLRAMVSHARHDLLLISDSNVRAPKCYLSEAVSALDADPRVGLVTHLFSGTGERTLGDALENVQLNGFVAAGSALPTSFGQAAVVGKSMLFRRSVFERLGGFESVSDLLAEDFYIGKMFQHGGYRVLVAPTVLESVNGTTTVRGFLSRQLRWSMLRIRLMPLAFLLEPLTSPVAMLPFALYVLGPIGWAWAAALLLIRDAAQWWWLRGPRGVYLAVFLGGARDLAMLGVWVATPFMKHVVWRGRRVRLGTGTRVFDLPAPSTP